MHIQLVYVFFQNFQDSNGQYNNNNIIIILYFAFERNRGYYGRTDRQLKCLQGT